MVASLAPNLILIGFMGTGKSTIGRLCARALRYRFVDTDARVERRTGLSVSEVFAQCGEAEFRRLERMAVEELASRANVVISTGGGAVLDPANVETLRASGILVWLVVEPAEILRRCGNCETRPLLADADEPLERIRTMLSNREPSYSRAADLQVMTTGLKREDAARLVLDAFRRAASTWPVVPGRKVLR
jgi:shikimate kinase